MTGAPAPGNLVAMMMALGGDGRMIVVMAELANRDTGATVIVMTGHGVMTAATVGETAMSITMTPVGVTLATGVGTAKTGRAIAAATIGHTTVANVSVRASVTEVAIAIESGIGSEMIVIGMSAIEAVVLMTELARGGRESV